MNQAGGCGADDLAEVVRVFDLSVHGSWAVELRVVEGVEGFEAKLEGSRVGEAEIFLEGHVEVVNSRAVEDATFGIAELAQVFFRKESGVECGAPVSAVGVDLERTWEVLRRVEEIVVCAVAERAEE